MVSLGLTSSFVLSSSCVHAGAEVEYEWRSLWTYISPLVEITTGYDVDNPIGAAWTYPTIIIAMMKLREVYMVSPGRKSVDDFHYVMASREDPA